MENVKRVPYGVSNFEDIIRRNQYYVDKTMYLPKLEAQPDTLFFIRPRRFGKSLLVSMMKAYYDCNKKDDFQKLFGNLWIGKNPTPLQGAYQVLHLDFSQVGGSIDEIKDNFYEYCGIMLNGFMYSYDKYYPEEIKTEFFQTQSATGKMAILFNQAKELGYHLFLIIDEYDNFTNTILSVEGEEVYSAITHADGFFRDVFKKFKGNFERIFMTGVSPVTVDDATSGFNIGWNISTKPDFNEMLGFSTQDVRELFTYYKEVGQIPADSDVEKIIEDMKPWYDNYCFAEECLKKDIRMFNTDMVLYYLRNYMEYGCPPRQMIDPNTRTDYRKMKMILNLDKLDGDRKGLLCKIAEDGEIVANVRDSFSATELADQDVFPSMLFYYGMLTIKGMRGDQLVLGIPNNNVRKQYYKYLLEQYQEIRLFSTNDLRDMFTDMAYDGIWRPALELMAKEYAAVSSIRDTIEGERNLQGFFMAYLNLSNYYYTAPELELNHGYCDFFLLPDLTHYETKHSYILELKMLPKKEYNEEKAAEQWSEAIEQIRRYAVAPRVEALRQGTHLHKIIMQFSGWELMRMEEI